MQHCSSQVKFYRTYCMLGLQFIGTIPEEYGSMKRLRSLELEGNKLYGTVPASFK